MQMSLDPWHVTRNKAAGHGHRGTPRCPRRPHRNPRRVWAEPAAAACAATTSEPRLHPVPAATGREFSAATGHPWSSPRNDLLL